jgi:hypothetical protein
MKQKPKLKNLKASPEKGRIFAGSIICLLITHY